MSTEKKPSSFYKYCPVHSSPEKIIKCDNPNQLEELGEYSLLNLFNHQAKFSSRIDFNDLFDTRINFTVPDKREVKSFLRQLSVKKRREAKPFFDKKIGQINFKKYRDQINELFDNYKMYCVTIKGNNNLMWSHYANNHQGFCIEFDANKLIAEKVSYEPELAKFRLLNIVKENYGLITKKHLRDLISAATLTKLDEWGYEKEYRITASHEMDRLFEVQKAVNFSIYKTNPDWVKAIIFGHRMDEKIRRYIINTYKNNVKYKIAEPDMQKGTINILNY
ncbi:DUF2971 domain-containing protein [Agarivorans sp. DSG3-1]|uniref:DUF2971 domain-containing protein n=1 Tax=Agarivorans sp. DSG3-1 TaxID=3342249 RepID=UPI00398F3C3E